MASRGVFSWSVAMLLVAMVAGAAASTKHVVGNSTGWTIPPNATFYSDWAASQKIFVGDSLVFNFQTGTHNVIEVAKSDYDACTSKNKIGSAINTGPATVTISSAGQHFYICGVTGHCNAGQKLAITVTGSSTTAQAPAQAPGGPAPAGSTPTTTPPPSPESASGPSATKGSSSATSLASGFPMAVAFSLVFGFLI
ncbi:Cupredoxins domain-containing protein [Dioscorea alata]|uniref:Cupredoxins domain-containing protein n=1 Tax=Dioscorea alata TaxID=55571 RepID=A0ACB7WFQ7_DIOAL|nr:Cupredoxins domain-containing protein [Dioscorea alata]